MTRPRRVLIVGAGLAGHTVGQQLRQAGFDGEIVGVGAELHRPYDRPPLSKQYLSGALTRADLALEADGDADIAWQLGAAAARLDLAERAVELDDGRRLIADEIVLATGARPRSLGGPQTGLYSLGTIEDADALRTALVPGAEVVIVGAGFLGLEIAATAIGAGAAVSVVCADEGPLADRHGPLASSVIRRLHERHGVRFVTGARVASVSVEGSRADGVVLDDGRRIGATAVIAGTGAAPAVEWLVGSGLDLAGGVQCDADGRAAPGVWAVGDCAVWAGETCGHWTLATQRARHVARLLAGVAPANAEAPYVWSDQYDARLQFAGGLRGDELAVIEAGSPDGDDLFAVFVREGAEVAAFAVNQPRLMMRWRKTHRPPAAAA